VVEFILWGPIAGVYWFIGLSDGRRWFPALLTVILCLRLWWDYRRGGRGRKRQQANRANPSRGWLESHYPSG
jgi:hypothetical protein